MSCEVSEVVIPCRPCQSVGKASLAAAIIVVAAGLTLIFLFDLPGGDDVGPGPMCKYKLITTHFQVRCQQILMQAPSWALLQMFMTACMRQNHLFQMHGEGNMIIAHSGSAAQLLFDP